MILKCRLLCSDAHLNFRLAWRTMSLDKILVDIALPNFRTNYACSLGTRLNGILDDGPLSNGALIGWRNRFFNDLV